VSVSATTLPQRSTLILAALAIVIASAISFIHMALPWDPGRRITFDRIYVIGIWVSLVCGVVFIAAYTNRVAHEARQLADALTATELALSRHEQLSALDGLAAAAAHELGTPLSTIALAAKEMKADIPPGPLADDVDLIIAQSARCRAILAKLRSLRSGEVGDPFAAVPVGELLEEVAKPLEGFGKSIFIEIPESGDEPVFKRNAGLLYGLGNLIENATQFAKTRVNVDANWDRSTIGVTITDDGAGYPDDLITRLGEPYLTTRARNTAPDGDAPGGLGLGIFIAKTLLERTGARLAFENAAGGGAKVTITWPRQAVEG
jgi:two-component system sensor histidine kinase RegB